MLVYSGAATDFQHQQYEQLGQYRREVFIERLGWELNTRNGLELDQFDRPDTIYVVAKDHEGAVSGCARLLPTTRPYLLGEVFPQLLNGQSPPCSPDIWEISRFAAVDLKAPVGSSSTAQAESSVAVQVFQKAIDCAASHGAKRLISVTWISAERWLRKAGFNAHRAGPPMIINGHPLYACWIDY